MTTKKIHFDMLLLFYELKRMHRLGFVPVTHFRAIGYVPDFAPWIIVARDVHVDYSSSWQEPKELRVQQKPSAVWQLYCRKTGAYIGGASCSTRERALRYLTRSLRDGHFTPQAVAARAEDCTRGVMHAVLEM